MFEANLFVKVAVLFKHFKMVADKDDTVIKMLQFDKLQFKLQFLKNFN